MIDGRQVVVKVRRPGIDKQVATDLLTRGQVSRQLERRAGWARRMGIGNLVAGFARSLDEELDYRVEAHNTASLAEAMAPHGQIVIPEVLAEHSTPQVLVETRLDGVPLTQARPLLAGLEPQVRTEMARTMLTAVLSTMLREGIFHADLHPGNVMVWADGRIGLLDFGSVGRLDAATRQGLVALLLAIDADDSGAGVDALQAILDPPAHLDDRALRRDLGELFTNVRLGTGTSVDTFVHLTRLIVAHGFTIPNSLAAALRCLGALEGTLGIIDPRIDLIGTARSLGTSSALPMDAGALKDAALARLAQMLPMLERVPRSLARITDDLEHGRFSTNIRVFSDPRDRRFIESITQQISGTLLAAAGVLGGIMLVLFGTGTPLFLGLNWLNFAGYLLTFAGFILSLRVVVGMFHRQLGPDDQE